MRLRWQCVVEKWNELRIKQFTTKEEPKTIRNLLIHKLVALKVPPYIVLWISAFFKERTQVVTVRGVSSKACDVKSGVPQGCVLSPALFALYINDMYSLPLASKIISYADDTKLINLTTNSRLLQSDLDLISVWCVDNYVIINTCKTVFMRFGKTKVPAEYRICGAPIQEVSNYKDLGILIDNKLTFSNHCNALIKKCSWLTRSILKLFKHRSALEYFHLFKIYVRPIIEYNIYFWFPYSKLNMSLIESIQRKFTKRICDGSLTYEQRLSKIGDHSLHSRYLFISALSTYKIINNLLSVSVNYNYTTNSKSRRGCHKIFIPFIRNNHRKNFCIYRCIKVWNSLPDSLMNDNNYPLFRQALVKHIPELRA